MRLFALLLRLALLSPAVALAAAPGTDLILRDAPAGSTPAAAAAAELVRVDAAVLAAAPERLWLEPVAGEGRWAYRNAAEAGAGGGLVWRGRFAEDDPGYSSVTLTLHDGAVLGRVELPGGPTWLLRPRRRGGSSLSVELSTGAECGVGRDLSGLAAPPPVAPPDETAPRSADRATAAAEEREVYLLVLYTPAAAANVGAGFIEQTAPHLVDLLNTTLINSGVDGRVSLAGVAPVELGMHGLSDQQAVEHAFRHPAAQALQDRYRADVVTVVADGDEEFVSAFCGWSNLMFLHLRGPQMANQAYSVIADDCFGVSWLLTHEVAHNFGAQHDAANASPPEFAAYPFSFAHWVEGHFRTVMSYPSACGDCDFLRTVLSNPQRSVDGLPTGIPDQRDNARTLSLTFPLVASFRGGRPPPPAPAAPSDLSAVALSPHAVALAWKDNAFNESGYQVEGFAEAAPAAGWERLAELPADAAEHVVEGLAADSVYRFRVRAVRSGAASAFSGEATVRTPPALPATPTGLGAAPLSAGEVALSFTESARATGYEVELRGADPAADRAAGPLPVALGGESLLAVVDGLAADAPYTFRVRAVSAAGVSPWSDEASATTEPAEAAGPCTADGSTLCLLDGRFAVSARWRNPRAPFNFGTAAARAVAGSERTGLFTFFNPDNVELAVKMLDGRTVNGSFWHFFGALSDVEYWVTARDGETGDSRTYHNPPFEICGRGDTAAFAGEAEAPPGGETLSAWPAPAEAEACAAGSETLCLAGGRFEVEVDWTNPRVEGDAGVGRVFAAAGGERTGHFWFFRPDNLELSVKVLDGRAINGHFWIFWGGLSDVGYTIRVTDTTSGAEHELENPPLTLCGGAVTDLL